MRCLITGATGFVGGHLAAALARTGHEVAGLTRRLTATAGFPLHVADVTDMASVENVLNVVRPDWLFHLAAFASPAQSFVDPAGAWAANLGGAQVLYGAVHRSGLRPRILHVSSGLVYGDPVGPAAFTEDAPLRPASPYAASKAAADLLAYQQTRSPGLDIVRVRPFNQIGPGQSTDYAAANFARQIATAELGRGTPVVTTGDLSTQRDLTDVRDMVRAYIRLMEVGTTGEVFNAGSGTTIAVRDLLDRLVALARVKVEVVERTDPRRARDTAISRANTTQIRAATGWAPEFMLGQTLADVLDDWRGRVGSCDEINFRPLIGQQGKG